MSRLRSRPARWPCAASERPGQVLRPDVEGESEEKFLQSLSQFITDQTQYLQCPREGVSELRYVLYRSVFNKLISRSSSYKRILLCVKNEFDQVIRAVSQRLEETTHDALGAPQSCSHDALGAPHHRTVQDCQSRARLLRDRICVLRSESAALQLQQHAALQLQLQPRRGLSAGLMEAQSEDPELLEEVVEELGARRAALLEERSHCVDVGVRFRLEQEQEVRERRRHQAKEENQRLKLLYKRLQCVCDSVRLWKEEAQCCPLEDLLLSAQQQVTHITVTEAELESEEAQDLTESLLRFVDLFDSAHYREAAEHAAHSPRGALRNLHTVRLFQAVPGPPPSPPPLLLLVQALLVSTPSGQRLPEDVSFEVVRCALEQGHWRLLTNALHFDKLSLSERLGHLLTEHAHRAAGTHQAPHQSDLHQSDLLMGLASVCFRACGAHRSLALSLCSRGLVHSSVQLMRRELSAEEVLWVFGRSPSLRLLQLLTMPCEEGSSLLSVGEACVALLSAPHLQDYALQLLHGLLTQGPGALQGAILGDPASTLQQWLHICALCSSLQPELSQAISTALLSQSGTARISPDPEGARLTQHLYM